MIIVTDTVTSNRMYWTSESRTCICVTMETRNQTVQRNIIVRSDLLNVLLLEPGGSKFRAILITVDHFWASVEMIIVHER